MTASAEQLATWVALLRAGKVLSCPTETLQGLLADALNPEAVARVVALKQRGPEPIAVLVPSLAVARTLCTEPFSEQAQALAAQHWPGPLTLVCPAREGLPAPICPHGTLGVRVPGPSPALDLVRAWGGPLTATSCNLSGQPPACTEHEVRAYFARQLAEGELAAMVPGDAPGGLPSTVVDARTLRVLRAGAVSLTSA